VQEYVGGYSDWLRQGHDLAVTDSPIEAEQKKRDAAERRKNKISFKLSYKDQRELDRLPEEIQRIEAHISDLQNIVAAPDFYARGNEIVQQTLRELSETESRLEQHVNRWGELESMNESLRSR